MNPLVIRIALSFIVAGSWISIATLIGERLGSRKAGLISNLPSNLLTSMLFMGLTKGPEYAAAATAGVPMGMMIACIFLAVFIFIIPRGLGIALAVSTVAWALVAVFVIMVLPPLSLLASVLVWAVVMTVLFIIVKRHLHGIKVTKKPVVFSWKILALRAFFAGSVVASAVAIAQIAPPYMTGVLSTFPAAIITTMVILSLSQGPAFAQATGKIIILTTGNIIVYSTSVGIVFPLIGPWLGTLVSFAAAVLFIYLLGKLTEKIA